MSTRCRPGDIAIIVRGSAHQVLGRMVTVLHAAPVGAFRLPDGMKHQPLSFAVYPFSTIISKIFAMLIF